MKKYLLTLLFIPLLNGCGNSNTSDQQSAKDPKVLISKNEQTMLEMGLIFKNDNTYLDNCLSANRATCLSQLEILTDYSNNVKNAYGPYNELSDMLQKRIGAVESCIDQLNWRLKNYDNGPFGCH